MKITFPEPIEGQTHWALRGSNPDSEPILIPVMSRDTDETARAIAECQHVDYFNFDPLFKQDRFAHLQAMARLWLMRDEIAETLKRVPDYPFTCPKCGGHYFGTEWPDGIEAERRIVQCHDQNATGCNWQGEEYEFYEAGDLLKRIAEVENGE